MVYCIRINTILLTRIIISVFLIGNIYVTAQQEPGYQLEDIIVTASRAPLKLTDFTRSIIIISAEEIKKAPVRSVQDLLKYVAGIELKRRGVDGVQGDVSIRGGSFEQTLIMIDAVKITDPQTSHHNLNLPISPNDIEKIEILKGQGSHIYGPNAFSGIINIITKTGNRKSISSSIAGGDYSYYDYNLGLSYPMGNFSNRASFSRQKSDGYIHNTEFEIMNFSYKSSFRIRSGGLNLFFGYNDKKFGANNFYSDIYPDQWEHTTTKLFNFGGDIGNNTFTVSPKIYWRRNDDNYLLDYQNPSFYENIHQSDTYGAEIQSTIFTGIGTLAIGGEFISSKLTSTNLGDHNQNSKGLFTEFNFSPIKNLTVILGGFAYGYSDFGWKLWPGLDLAYEFSKNVKMFGSVGKAFRVPSYTELFYLSPTISGNPELKPEETLNYESGIRYFSKAFIAEGSIFRNEGKNIIDYVRLDSAQTWAVRNIAEVNTTGFEINTTLKISDYITDFPIGKINIGYTYIYSDKQTANFNSLYVLDYLRDQLVVDIDVDLGFGIKQSINMRYENRINFEDHFIVDSQIFRTFNEFKIFMNVTNIFNKTYHEIGGVQLPGRWFKVGVQFDSFF